MHVFKSTNPPVGIRDRYPFRGHNHLANIANKWPCLAIRPYSRFDLDIIRKRQISNLFVVQIASAKGKNDRT